MSKSNAEIKLTGQLTLVVQPELEQAIREVAKRQYMPLSTWLTQAAVKAIREYEKEVSVALRRGKAIT